MLGFCSGLLYKYSLKLKVGNRFKQAVWEKNLLVNGGVGTIILWELCGYWRYFYETNFKF